MKEFKARLKLNYERFENDFINLVFCIKMSKKDVFLNRHEQLDLVKDCAKFLNLMKDIKPYLVEFNEDDTIKDKVYCPDYVVNNNDY